MDRFQSEFLAGRPQVALLIEVAAEELDGGAAQLRDVVVGQEGVDTEVEFPPRDQIRVRDVLLQDHCLILTEVLLVDRVDYLARVIEYLYAMTSVSVLSRFQDPYVIAGNPSELLELLVLLGVVH